MEKYFSKLVRDKIPEIIKHNGDIPTIRILEDKEYKEELLKKLIEECNEVLNAKTNIETLEELADTLEVIDAIVKLMGFNIEDVKKIQEEKKNKRGSFDKKIFLIKTKSKED